MAQRIDIETLQARTTYVAEGLLTSWPTFLDGTDVHPDAVRGALLEFAKAGLLDVGYLDPDANGIAVEDLRFAATVVGALAGCSLSLATIYAVSTVFDIYFELGSRVFVYPYIGSLKSSFGLSEKFVEWPSLVLAPVEERWLSRERRAVHLIMLGQLIRKVWGESTSMEPDAQVVGSVDGTDITRSGVVFIRKRGLRRKGAARKRA